MITDPHTHDPLLFVYDGTLEGLLSCVFYAYLHKLQPHDIVPDYEPLPIFCAHTYTVPTTAEHSRRVWAALLKKLSPMGRNTILHVWLSEMREREMLLFRYICKNIDYKGKSIETNFADADVLRCREIAHKVGAEAHKMKEFVRFQEMADGIYFAPIKPKYDVLSLIESHFRKRFGSLRWIIYDVRRSYGLHCRDGKTEEITLDLNEHISIGHGRLSADIVSQQEQMLRQMWQTYFKTLAIPERFNPKVQRGHMPRRFWSYLTEMQEE